MTVPKLIAFDLDGTIWSPDMYQLCGGGIFFKTKYESDYLLSYSNLGPPFSGDGTKNILDKKGTPIRLLGVVRSLLHDLKHNPEWKDTAVAWVSRTDEPAWAMELLALFKTTGGDSIGTVAHSSQIYHGNKINHFNALKREYPNIEFSEMLFFDNEYDNIRSVSTLGVKCVFCPDGVTEMAWKDGLKLFTT